MRALIIDDELPARRKIITFLQDEPEIEIVGEADDGLKAITAIEQLKPDLIFLDIQMPHLTGFEVLQQINESIMPKIIFTTAYDQYALKAFEVHAIDYLLKPFDQERFQKALKHALQPATSQLPEQLSSLISALNKQRNYLQRLLIKITGRIIIIKVEDIDWIEAEEKYVQLHVGKDKYLYRETMSTLEQELDPQKFVRIHRSYIVQLDFIKELSPWSHGDYLVILKDGTELNMGRNYRERLLNC